MQIGVSSGMLLYSYLNLESTKTDTSDIFISNLLYSYLNLESTKTLSQTRIAMCLLYSYLNLESTKTFMLASAFD